MGAAGAIMVVGLLFPFPLSGRIWMEVFNLAHAPAFCGLQLLLCGILHPQTLGLRQSYAVIQVMTPARIIGLGLLLTAAGVLGELGQSVLGRHASIGDIVSNTSGLLAATLWLLSRNKPRLLKGVLRMAAPMIILFNVQAPIRSMIDCWQQTRSFPVLASFERPLELGSWGAKDSEISRSRDWSTDGEHSLKIALTTEQFSCAAFWWFEGDWSGYQALQFDVFNPEPTPVELIVKIEDHQHAESDFEPTDRYQELLTLDPGSTRRLTISVQELRQAPRTREMDLTQMKQIEFFTFELTTPRTIYVDQLRLVP